MKNMNVTVAQICNLLYRRIAFGRACERKRRCELATPRGFQIRDTAEAIAKPLFPDDFAINDFAFFGLDRSQKTKWQNH